MANAVGKEACPKCPSCEDVGWFPVQTDYDEWEQQQCEFCYTVEDSIFMRKAATEQGESE
jgi:hypothetical protein